jgi:hypothetical protein
MWRRAAAHRTPGETERQALQRRVRRPGHQPLDPRGPLWQFHLVEDYEGGSALVSRIHHCIGDGIALISVMLSITDGGKPTRPSGVNEASNTTRHDWLSDALIKPLTDLTIKAIGLYGEGMWQVAWTHWPTRSRLAALDMARTGLQGGHRRGALALMPDDSPTR